MTDRIYENFQVFSEFRREVGCHEFGQDLIVREFRIDDVLESVVQDEPVEPVGGKHDGPRDRNVQAFVFVGEGMLLDQVVKERQPPCLTPEGAVTDPGEPVIILIGILAELGDDALPDRIVVTLDLV